MNPTACSCSGSTLRAPTFVVSKNGDTRFPSNSFLGVPPPRSHTQIPSRVLNTTSRGRQTSLNVEANAGFAIGGSSGIAGGGLGQIAYGVVCIVGAALIGRELLAESSAPGEEDACPSCGGSGYEACMCTRWSDNDAGCGICEGTRAMKCKSCGGGGMKIPILLRIPAESRNRNEPIE